MLERILGFAERNPRKIILMPTFIRLPTELERTIFLIAAAEHANSNRYLLVAQQVRAW